jgi:hypothetical protein
MKTPTKFNEFHKIYRRLISVVVKLNEFPKIYRRLIMVVVKFNEFPKIYRRLISVVEKFFVTEIVVVPGWAWSNFF